MTEARAAKTSKGLKSIVLGFRDRSLTVKENFSASSHWRLTSALLYFHCKRPRVLINWHISLLSSIVNWTMRKICFANLQLLWIMCSKFSFQSLTKNVEVRSTNFVTPTDRLTNQPTYKPTDQWNVIDKIHLHSDSLWTTFSIQIRGKSSFKARWHSIRLIAMTIHNCYSMQLPQFGTYVLLKQHKWFHKVESCLLSWSCN